jgi:ribosomal protein L16 Arg81 hydroxylase
MDKIEYIKEFDLKIPTWDELLSNLNESILNEEEVRHNCMGFFACFEAHRLEKVAAVMKKIGAVDAHLYINISTNGKTFGNHCDTMDVYFWQCQGMTKWVFSNEKKEIVLSQGDLIMVPKGVYHNVIPLSSRAGISMSLGT